MIIWIKKAEIDYIKTATSNLHMDFELSENDIDNAVSALKENEKYEVWHTVKVYNSHSELCTESRVLVYIRNKYEHPLNNS
jgi:aspartokinase